MSTYSSDGLNSNADIPEPQMKHFCTYCQDEISSVPCQSNTAHNSMIIFIRCAICEDFYLCLMCFSSGAEIGPHKNNHDYKLVTFSKSNMYSEKLLSALEEWISEDTEKYLETEKLVLSWEDVANAVGSDNPEEVKEEYYSTYVDGHLGHVIKLVNNYKSYPQVVTLDQALKMKCFEDCPTNFPTKKYLKIPENVEREDDYGIYEEPIKSNLYSDNQSKPLNKKDTLDSYQIQLLLQCTGEFGFGNWEAITNQYNSIIHMEYPKRQRNYLSSPKIKDEYILRFIQKPILLGTWVPIEHKRPLIPDRTDRIQGPKSNYEDYLKEQLPIDDLDIFFNPSNDEDDEDDDCVIVESNTEPEELNEPKMNCSVCTYCQEEFQVIRYRSDKHEYSSYKIVTVYTCCTNKQTCENLYLCLVCLGSGAEIGKHKKHHSYKLITEMKTYSSKAHFRNSNWTAIEELAFLYALEEWTSKETDKYIDPLNSENLITDWDSVSQHIGSKSAIEAKTEFENSILNQKIWKIIQGFSNPNPLISYEDAVEMGCFNNFVESDVTTTNENKKIRWTKTQLKLLFEYMTIYGYGNWEKISNELNKTIIDEHYGRIDDCILRTPEEIKNECIHRFYDSPIKRGTWKSPSNPRPVILDRTRSFIQPVVMKYPIVDSNLFAQIGYNNVADEFEYPYMDTAESALNYIEDFENYSKTTQDIVGFIQKPRNQLETRPVFNIKEERTLIALEQYNDVLLCRKTAKKCVHNYRLIEQFAIYKDKELPKIKPFSEQSFGERLVKMSRFMTVDVHRALIDGAKNEKLLAHRLNELQFYKMIGLTKLSETNLFNSLHQKKQSTDLNSDSKCQTLNELLIPSGSGGKSITKYIRNICSKLSTSEPDKTIGRLNYLSNNKCEELLTDSEKTLCQKYNLDSNYYLKTKCKILNHGLQKDSSKIDCIIYKYLVYINKVNIVPPISK